MKCQCCLLLRRRPQRRRRGRGPHGPDHPGSRRSRAGAGRAQGARAGCCGARMVARAYGDLGSSSGRCTRAICTHCNTRSRIPEARIRKVCALEQHTNVRRRTHARSSASPPTHERAHAQAHTHKRNGPWRACGTARRSAGGERGCCVLARADCGRCGTCWRAQRVPHGAARGECAPPFKPIVCSCEGSTAPPLLPLDPPPRQGRRSELLEILHSLDDDND
jgi:hypothetical protein